MDERWDVFGGEIGIKSTHLVTGQRILAQVNNQPVCVPQVLHNAVLGTVCRVNQSDISIQNPVLLQRSRPKPRYEHLLTKKALLFSIPQDRHFRRFPDGRHLSENLVCVPAEKSAVPGTGGIWLYPLYSFLNAHSVHFQNDIAQRQGAAICRTGNHQLSLCLLRKKRGIGGHVRITGGSKNREINGVEGKAHMVVMQLCQQTEDGVQIAVLIVPLQHDWNNLFQAVPPVLLQEIVVGEIVLQHVPRPKQPQQAVFLIGKVHIRMLIFVKDRIGHLQHGVNLEVNWPLAPPDIRYLSQLAQIPG